MMDTKELEAIFFESRVVDMDGFGAQGALEFLLKTQWDLLDGEKLIFPNVALVSFSGYSELNVKRSGDSLAPGDMYHGEEAYFSLLDSPGKRKRCHLQLGSFCELEFDFVSYQISRLDFEQQLFGRKSFYNFARSRLSDAVASLSKDE